VVPPDPVLGRQSRPAAGAAGHGAGPPGARALSGVARAVGRPAACWAPLGRALLDYHRGDIGARFLVHSDLWEDELTPAEEYYRPLDQELPELERRALALCRGRVLDLGAGGGRHALELQGRGLTVTALDVSPEAVEVMRRRGVLDARCGGLEAVAGRRFDTILLLMHGIGLVGSLEGLDHFLEAASALLGGGGQVLCDSADLAAVMPALAEHRVPPPGPAGRYYGEVEFRLSYGGTRGEPYPWLFVDAQRLQRHAKAAAFEFEIGAWGARGAYLARLSKR